MLINRESVLGDLTLAEFKNKLNDKGIKTVAVSGEPNKGKSWLISKLADCYVP